MMRFGLILIGTVTVLNVCVSTTAAAGNENVTIEQIYDMASNILNATDKWQAELKEYSVEGRKSKFFPFLLPFHALWGFGGLHALGILFAIKFKIIIVASIIAFAVYYYAKFISVKKCHGGDHLREGGIFPVDSSYAGSTYFSSPVTSYSSPLDISSHISYPSVEPYSGYHDGSAIHSDIPSYAFDHHDHHDDFHDHHHDYHHDFHDHHHHDFDHHSHDFENYFADQPPPHDISSGGDSSMPPQSSVDGKDSQTNGNSPPTMSATYRRVGKHRRRRQATRPQHIDFIDIGELAFRFLGVDTEGCRKRFVCELDFRARTNPITRLAFTFIGRNFFERYRVLDENVAKPQKFSDCSRVFNDCKDAEKYNDVNDDEDENEEEEQEQESVQSTTNSPTDIQDENEKEGGGDSSQDEEELKQHNDNEINNRRKRRRTYKSILNVINRNGRISTE